MLKKWSARLSARCASKSTSRKNSLVFASENYSATFKLFIGLDRRYDGRRMKPQPAPSVTGNTDAERMNNAVRKFLSVPKEAYLKEEDRLKKRRERKKRAIKAS